MVFGKVGMVGGMLVLCQYDIVEVLYYLVDWCNDLVVVFDGKLFVGVEIYLNVDND